MKNIVHVTQYHSPYGKIFMGSDGKFLTGLWFEQQKYFPEDLVDAATNKELPVFAQTREWLNRYFQRIQPDFTPAIRLDDTPFRVAVWEILQTIPYGRTTTYKQIAEEIARRKAIPHMSAQARKKSPAVRQFHTCPPRLSEALSGTTPSVSSSLATGLSEATAASPVTPEASS